MKEFSDFLSYSRFIFILVIFLSIPFAIFLIDLFRSIKKKKIFKAIYCFLLTIFFGIIIASISYLNIIFYRYHVLTRTYPVANISITPKTDGMIVHFKSQVRNIEGFMKDVKGERFHFEGIFIDFKPSFEFLGFKPIFKLTSFYTTKKDGTLVERFIFDQRSYSFFDDLLENYEKYIIFDKVFGTSVFQNKRKEIAVYVLKQDTNGIFLELISK